VNNFLDVVEMYESKGKTYDPAEDGFVFSESQINAALWTRNQERVIEEAHESAA
jgi:hypothetical protein